MAPDLELVRFVVRLAQLRARQLPAASSDFSSSPKSTSSSPTSRSMMARRRSFSARAVLYRPASRSARALASQALSLHSARALDASSAAIAASATTSRHAFSICDSVRDVPSVFGAPACNTLGARPVHARAALSSVTSRAFSAFSFSTSSVSERFFLAISTILDSRTPAESRSPPVSSAVLSSAYSRSFASSACKSSWLRRVSSWTCVSRSKEGQVSWLGDIRGNTSETAMGVNRHASERRARRAPHMRGRTWPKPSHVKFSLFPAAVAIALPRLRSSARASRRGESR